MGSSNPLWLVEAHKYYLLILSLIEEWNMLHVQPIFLKTICRLSKVAHLRSLFLLFWNTLKRKQHCTRNAHANIIVLNSEFSNRLILQVLWYVFAVSKCWQFILLVYANSVCQNLIQIRWSEPDFYKMIFKRDCFKGMRSGWQTSAI